MAWLGDLENALIVITCPNCAMYILIFKCATAKRILVKSQMGVNMMMYGNEWNEPVHAFSWLN